MSMSSGFFINNNNNLGLTQAQSREDSDDLVKTIQLKCQRLNEELNDVKEQLSQAHVDKQVLLRKLEVR